MRCLQHSRCGWSSQRLTHSSCVSADGQTSAAAAGDSHFPATGHVPTLSVPAAKAAVGLVIATDPDFSTIVSATGAAWLWNRGRFGRTAWPALLFMTFLVTLQMVSEFSAPTGSAFAFARLGLVVYLAVTAVAWLADLGKHRDEA